MAMWFSVSHLSSYPRQHTQHTYLGSGNWVDPSWVALDESRGIESTESQIFMRSTVLFFDALVYIPAVILFTRIWQQGRSHRTQVWTTVVFWNTCPDNIGITACSITYPTFSTRPTPNRFRTFPI